LDPVCGGFMAWKSVMPALIWNYFVQYGFSTASSINTEDDDKKCEWVELWCHSAGPRAFDEFLMSTNLFLLLVISHQILTAQAPGPCT
jgi:hypothetical protein